MWIIYVMAVMMAIVGNLSVTTVQNEIALHNQNMAAAAAMHFGVYASASASYAIANPGFVGSIPIGALNLPTWYVPLSGMAAYKDATRVYVYFPEPTKSQGAITLRGVATNTSVAGLVIGGTVYGPTNIALFPAPPGAADNSVVLVAR